MLVNVGIRPRFDGPLLLFAFRDAGCLLLGQTRLVLMPSLRRRYTFQLSSSQAETRQVNGISFKLAMIYFGWFNCFILIEWVMHRWRKSLYIRFLTFYDLDLRISSPNRDWIAFCLLLLDELAWCMQVLFTCVGFLQFNIEISIKFARADPFLFTIYITLFERLSPKNSRRLQKLFAYIFSENYYRREATNKTKEDWWQGAFGSPNFSDRWRETSPSASVPTTNNNVSRQGPPLQNMNILTCYTRFPSLKSIRNWNKWRSCKG